MYLFTQVRRLPEDDDTIVYYDVLVALEPVLRARARMLWAVLSMLIALIGTSVVTGDDRPQLFFFLLAHWFGFCFVSSAYQSQLLYVAGVFADLLIVFADSSVLTNSTSVGRFVRLVLRMFFNILIVVSYVVVLVRRRVLGHRVGEHAVDALIDCALDRAALLRSVRTNTTVQRRGVLKSLSIFVALRAYGGPVDLWQRLVRRVARGAGYAQYGANREIVMRQGTEAFLAELEQELERVRQVERVVGTSAAARYGLPHRASTGTALALAEANMEGDALRLTAALQRRTSPSEILNNRVRAPGRPPAGADDPDVLSELLSRAELQEGLHEVRQQLRDFGEEMRVIHSESADQLRRDLLETQRSLLAPDLQAGPGAHCDGCHPASPGPRGAVLRRSRVASVPRLYGECWSDDELARLRDAWVSNISTTPLVAGAWMTPQLTSSPRSQRWRDGCVNISSQVIWDLMNGGGEEGDLRLHEYGAGGRDELLSDMHVAHRSVPGRCTIDMGSLGATGELLAGLGAQDSDTPSDRASSGTSHERRRRGKRRRTSNRSGAASTGDGQHIERLQGGLRGVESVGTVRAREAVEVEEGEVEVEVEVEAGRPGAG